MPKHLKKINSVALKESVAKGDFKSAKKLIDAFLDQEPTKEDKGKVFTETVHLYVDMVNSLNSSYLIQLNKTAEALKAIDAGEKEVDDAMQIIKTRKKLRSVVQEDDLDE